MVIRQRPLLLPLLAMAFGLCSSYHKLYYCSASIVIASLACLFLSSFLRHGFLFHVLTFLFFFAWGSHVLTLWLEPNVSPTAVTHHAERTPCIIQGVIAARPILADDGGTLVVEVEHLIRGQYAEPADGLILLKIRSGQVELNRGDRIRFVSRISTPRLLGLPGEFDYPRYLALQRIYATATVAGGADIVLMRGGVEDGVMRRIDMLSARLSEIIRKTVKDNRVSSVLVALLLGEQKRIPKDLADAYSVSGVNHILSISGFHVGIISVAIMYVLLRLLSLSEYLVLRINVRSLALVIAIPAMVFYLFLSGAAPATARSVAMLVIWAAAFCLDRETDPFNTLVLAAFILVSLYPPTLFDISFQFSFLALWGIVALVPAVMRYVPAGISGRRRTLILFLATSSAASLVMALPVLFVFKQASINGILTNFIIVPILGYGAVLAGFSALPFLLVIPSQAQVILWPAAKLVEVSNYLIRFFAQLPVIRSYEVNGWDLACLILLLFVFTLMRNSYSRMALATVIVLVGGILHLVAVPAVDGRLHITMLSVGQAESLLVRLPDGSTMLVDGGGFLHDTGKDFGEQFLFPALYSYGIRKIDRMVVTHAHPDHIGGLPFVAARLPVGELWEGGDGSGLDVLERTLAHNKARIKHLHAGERYSLPGNVSLEVLSPPVSSGNTARLTGEPERNEESLVFRLVYGSFRMLFTADAGFRAEQAMLSSGRDIRSDVLKVGHHGSRFSSSDSFLDTVAPKAALISAGAGNRFGLPSRQTLAALNKRGVTVYRTDNAGTIELESDGREWWINTPFAFEVGQ